MGIGGRSRDMRRPRREAPLLHMWVPMCTWTWANVCHMGVSQIFFFFCDVIYITCVRDKIKLCEWDAKDYMTHWISSYILLQCAYKHLHNLLCSLKLQIKDVCNIQHPKCSRLNYTAVWYIFISKLWKALVKPKASDYNAGSSRNSCSIGVCVCVRIYTLHIHYVEWMSSAANKGIRFNNEFYLAFHFWIPTR